jgi:dTDP-4-dehydrorhamnose reductase
MDRPGPRPKYAEMTMNALRQAGFALPRSWQEALAEYIGRFWKEPPVKAGTSPRT